jgi:uncharacterized repeat protein (TIGR01451 family)
MVLCSGVCITGTTCNGNNTGSDYLKISKTVNKLTTLYGDIVIWNIFYHNNRTGTLFNTIIDDILPMECNFSGAISIL